MSISNLMLKGIFSAIPGPDEFKSFSNSQNEYHPPKPLLFLLFAHIHFPIEGLIDNEGFGELYVFDF